MHGGPDETGDARDDAGGPAVKAGSSPRLYQRVLDILTAEIIEGALTAGTPLNETAIAARFGISRAPTRRALAELECRGLVEKSATRGYTVGGPAVGVPRAAAQSVPTGPPEAHRLVSRPSWERIYGEVESEIIARTSFATWRVNEVALARHYGVSRTVIRDVVGRLQQSGVVQKDDRARWFAPALTPEHVGELYELRWLLEPAALARAAPNLPDGLVAEQRADLFAVLGRVLDIDGATLDRLEHDLHVRLLGYCGSRTLMQAIALPQALLIAHRFLYRWTARLFDVEPLIPEHLDVLDRLHAGHVPEAAKALENHLRVSRDRAITRIEVIARGPQPEPTSYLERLWPVS
jgi:DNA-binding GntR family transcriptional regulator